MRITVRPAREGDYPAVAAVGAELQALHAAGRPDVFRPGGQPLPEDYFAAHIEGDRHMVYVAERREAAGAGGDADKHREGRVIGYMLLSRHSEPSNEIMNRRAVATVEQIGVLAAERGHGAGHVLMARAKEWAREQGAAVLRLHVYEFNIDALAFYERVGMATASRFMELTLPPGEELDADNP